jgi:hypothetical protein
MAARRGAVNGGIRQNRLGLPLCAPISWPAPGSPGKLERVKGIEPSS